MYCQRGRRRAVRCFFCAQDHHRSTKSNPRACNMIISPEAPEPNERKRVVTRHNATQVWRSCSTNQLHANLHLYRALPHSVTQQSLQAVRQVPNTRASRPQERAPNNGSPSSLASEFARKQKSGDSGSLRSIRLSRRHKHLEALRKQ